MSVTLKQPLRIVELSECVKVETNIQEPLLAALRSGFAGYPSNPRWTAAKFHAWKTGRQWRQALTEGTLTVRGSDFRLVPTTETEGNESSLEVSRLSRGFAVTGKYLVKGLSTPWVYFLQLRGA